MSPGRLDPDLTRSPHPSPTGLNGVNFLIPAGQPPAGMAVNPTLAVPYVLLPSAALSHYPLVAGGLQPQDSQNSHTGLSFSLPSVMPQPRYMVGAVPYSLTAGPERPPPATPEHSRLQGALTGTPKSPSGPHQTVNVSTPEPLVGRFPTAPAPLVFLTAEIRQMHVTPPLTPFPFFLSSTDSK